MKVSDALDSNFIYAGDLDGREVTLPIDRVEPAGVVKRADKRLVDKPVLYFQGQKRGLVLCKTNMRRIQLTHGNETSKWTGKKITIYPTTTDVTMAMAEQAGCSILGIKGNMATVPCIRVRAPKGLFEPLPLLGDERPIMEGQVEW